MGREEVEALSLGYVDKPSRIASLLCMYFYNIKTFTELYVPGGTTLSGVT